MRLRFSAVAVVLGVVAALVPPAVLAQDFRGSIQGVVTDSQGGAMPGVSVTVTNLNTNVTSNLTTDGKGQYRAQYLISGSYAVQMQLQGFKSLVRKPLEVRIGDVLTVDAVLETGAVEEVIEVVASQPLLDTSSGVTGTVVDSNQIAQLPLADGTAYMLTRLAPGLSDSSDLHFSRPMDNGNLAGIVANGALGGNDFTLDGAPNRVSPNQTTPGNNNGVVGFSPPSDAIAEFKVQTNAFDAQSGQTAGASVNLALKSGTNALHGNLSYFNRSDSRSETPLLTQRAGAEKPTRDYNRHTATITGPIRRDQTFFMVSYEHLRDVQPEPATYTVPTARMRAGDLSEFTTLIYDPLDRDRQHQPAHALPRQPRARRDASTRWPPPTRRCTRSRTGPGLEDNYFTNQLRPYDYNAVLGRIDHNFDSANRLFVSGYWNKRQEDRYNWAAGASNATAEGVINGFEVTRGFDYRSNTGVTMGFTSTRSSRAGVRPARVLGEVRRVPGAVADVRPGEPRLLRTAPRASSATTSTCRSSPSAASARPTPTRASPRSARSGRTGTRASTGRSPTCRSRPPSPGCGARTRSAPATTCATAAGTSRTRATAPAATTSPAPTRARTTRRPQNELGPVLGAVPARPAHRRAPTRWRRPAAPPASSRSRPAATTGRSPTASSCRTTGASSRRLTLNLGLRFELDQALTESGDRNLGGFDAAASSPIEAAARARYAANPIPQIAARATSACGAACCSRTARSTTRSRSLCPARRSRTC